MLVVSAVSRSSNGVPGSSAIALSCWIVVSMPAWRKIGVSWLCMPSSTARWPVSEPLIAKVSRPVSGPLNPASNRLKPMLLLTPIGSSVSYENDPAYSGPPVRVTMETIPPVAFPNSAELEPVVTDASSNPFVEIWMLVPVDPTNVSPR